MYLSKIRLINYKSFRNSGDIEFKSGINIIVGQNNSGKTALLEGLSGKFSNKPHRNEESSNFQGASFAEITLSIESDELRELLSKPENRTIIIPQPLNGNIDGAVIAFNNCLESKLSIKIRIDNGSISLNTLLMNFMMSEKKIGTTKKHAPTSFRYYGAVYY